MLQDDLVMSDADVGVTPTPAVQPASTLFDGPYLKCLQSLQNAFPALRTFLVKLSRLSDGEKDDGFKAVRDYYSGLAGHNSPPDLDNQEGPGRCRCLHFGETEITADHGFSSVSQLREYLEKNPAKQRRMENIRRLFILEDITPGYIDTLGHHLGVDPLVFSEQMNTWNFTDSWSIPHRGLPSLSRPEESFTLRYYEIRTLFDEDSIDVLTLQHTFAVNRRRYERWRDIDVPSAGEPDRRHAFVRRCASFWTSQFSAKMGNVAANEEAGWDAVILVDPAFASTKLPSALAPTHPVRSQQSQHVITNEKNTTKYPSGPKTDEVEGCFILQSADPFKNRASLWAEQGDDKRLRLAKTTHYSWPYHMGCSTLAPLIFSHVGIGEEEGNKDIFKRAHNLTSPFDEMVYYWTKIATPELIGQTYSNSSNAAYYLLKNVAQHWVHQLELINSTIAKGEWFSDDYQARIDSTTSVWKWKTDLINVAEISKDINYMRRHLNHFWRAMILNLERLGVQLGNEGVNESASRALKDAQKDFLTIYTRMQPLLGRAENLDSVAMNLSNLRAAFKGIQDNEFGGRLSVFASAVFPLTLVASVFSMGDDYLPGKDNFWKLWAVGLPFCFAIGLALIYGARPWRAYIDLVTLFEQWRDNIAMALKYYGLIGTAEEKMEYAQRKETGKQPEKQAQEAEEKEKLKKEDV